MSSTSPDRQKKIRQKIYMKSYLAELGTLLGRVVLPEELCSLEKTEALREAAQKFRDQPVITREIDLAETREDRFKEFLAGLNAANSSSIFLWMNHAIDCGTLMVSSLQDITADFIFLAQKGDVLTLSTCDACDRLVLDFFDSKTKTQRLTIETQGKHWAGVRY